MFNLVILAVKFNDTFEFCEAKRTDELNETYKIWVNFAYDGLPGALALPRVQATQL